MKLPQILRLLKEEPLLITPGAHAALIALFTQHAALGKAEFQALREGTDSCGQNVEVDQAELVDGIMRIPICGPIGQGLGSFEKGAGAVDVSDIAAELQNAQDDPICRCVLLYVDSPGGMVSGTPELADKILAFEKPIYAYTQGCIGSAAYWIASATDGIFATKSADIGSVGVYIPWADYTEYFKAQGVKVDLIKSGKYKGMGYPGTALSDDQRNLLQERVSTIAEMFYAHVQMSRPDVESDTLQGQTFMAAEALDRGLIDQIVPDFESALSLL